jgi:N-acetylglucosaminyl-diphospho-decaprenol L-rhamnosyltransferase
MKLLVVFVNWRTPDLTVDALRALAPEIPSVPGMRVVIADNDSGDGSVDKIRAAIDAEGWTWASVLPTGRNGGFAFGNNAAIRPALAGDDKPDYVYLLNTDTLGLPGCLSELVAFLDANPKCGIAGGRAVNRDMTVRRSAFRFHSPLGELETTLKLGVATKLLKNRMVAIPIPEKPEPVDWVSGCSMMIRRAVFEQVGLLDDGYFMYYEETDFCFRAKQAGWGVWYVPASRVIHLVGQSSGVTGAKRHERRRPRYWFDSRRRFFTKHYGTARAMLADILWAGGYVVADVLRRVRFKPRQGPPWLWWDFVRYNVGAWAHRR